MQQLHFKEEEYSWVFKEWGQKPKQYVNSLIKIHIKSLLINSIPKKSSLKVTHEIG